MTNRQYHYYHADHLQSAQFITNARGEQYEHIEYTPYGELWTYKSKTAMLFLTTYNNFLAKQPAGLIEETAPGIDKLPFRFTGKELDEETGLYYYGARYLDPKYSRWLSGDPALNDYIPKAPINDEAKKHNENLPGMGGVFNTVNLHVYHYAGNNPVKYVDPDGRSVWAEIDSEIKSIIDKLYNDSPTFKKHYDNLLAEKAPNGQKILVTITTDLGKYAGNIVTNDSPVIFEADIETLDNKGNRVNKKMQATTDMVMAININIDLDRVYNKDLPLVDIIAEEVVHASDITKVGSEKWNEIAREENKLPYKDRPREISAKNQVKIILSELRDKRK